jgi:tricorn protease
MRALRAGLAAYAMLVAATAATKPAPSTPLLLHHPSLSTSSIAFDYAGEIWLVARGGGEAHRLVAGQGACSTPIFSPDGSKIAYTGTYDSNTDVYVVDAGGGEPRRLTYHPGKDTAVGWTPDGSRVLFSSDRETERDLPHLYTVPAAGGLPDKLPLPSGTTGSYSPDGARIAYSPFPQWQPAWKRYNGGQTTRIWIANLADSHIEKIPRQNSNDRNPLWVGNTVYFLSDRGGRVTLYAYDVATKAVREAVSNPRGFDITSVAAGPGGIVYSQFGALHILDAATGRTQPVPVTIVADFPDERPHMAKVEPQRVLHAAISPTGKRVLLEVRGEILSVPAEKGDVRNLTMSPGVADRDPAWSPDGKWVAWLSDASGEYALHLRSPDGLGPVRVISLGQPPSFFYEPHWSPDSHKIAFSDKRLNIWIVDLDHPVPVKIDTDRYDSPFHRADLAWSPDSQWLAYSKQLRNYLHATFVYSLAEKRSHQLTDGRSDVVSPRFDASGKYLYFIAGTNNGLAGGWLDLSSYGRVVNSSVYVMVLRNDILSPLAPESDEEVARDKDGDKEKTADKALKKGAEATPSRAPAVRIDFVNIDQRIQVLPIGRANYVGLEVGVEGVVFAASGPAALSDEDYLESTGEPPSEQVVRFDFKSRKTEPFLKGVDHASLAVAADGSKLLYAQKHKWFIVPADKAPKEGDGALKLDDLSVWVDPPAERRQMYHEVWRIERDFLYDPGFHGLDLAAAERTYEPFLAGIVNRRDLNTLFEEMTGHISVGHTFITGGAIPEQSQESVGLLGADIRVKDGHYQFARVLQGENWNPGLTAPLTQPGASVATGEYLLAVNGRPAVADGEVYRYFIGLAGKQTVLTVGSRADGAGSRQVTVVPIASEVALRQRAWMEGNRARVDQLSDGRLAYVYVPDTNFAGLANFNRYYYSQVGKQGAIIDERFNHGGQIADFIVEQLQRTPQMVSYSREGEEMIEPSEAIYGPKVMVINQMSGSGGDALPWLFRKAGIGPLVGVRTWGGLVGISGYPPLVDGGEVTAPRWGIGGTKGEWEIENVGIPPDIEVEQDPALVRQGHDPQLEKAVAVALEALAHQPPPTFQKPAAPRFKSLLPDEP